MGTIFQPTTRKARILQGEKTSFPILRQLPSGGNSATFVQGEWVGLAANGNGAEVALKIAANNEVAQAKNALLVIGDTTNDVEESGAVTCQQGYFRLETTAYKANDSYAVGDRLTVRYVAAFAGGVLAKSDSTTSTHFVAQVLIPPTNATANTPMTVLVFPVAEASAQATLAALAAADVAMDVRVDALENA